MTVKETSEYLRMPVPSVYYNAQKGILPTIKIGGRWRILRDRLEAEFPLLTPVEKPKKPVKSEAEELVDSIVRQLMAALAK